MRFLAHERGAVVNGFLSAKDAKDAKEGEADN
jgi:hypothetical protein